MISSTTKMAQAFLAKFSMPMISYNVHDSPGSWYYCSYFIAEKIEFQKRLKSFAKTAKLLHDIKQP